jgi:K+/H+ antiporter YhaU regulatory subunit KhtT
LLPLQCRRADKIPGGYVVRDASGQAIAYLYSRKNEAEARQAKVLTADEARRIARSIARLPELLATERQQGCAAQRPLVFDSK